MSKLLGLTEVRRAFAQSADARELATQPVEPAPVDSGINELVTPLLHTARELAEWMAVHEPSGELAVTLTWDERLVFVEVRDGGSDLPKPESSRADAELGVRLLAPPAVEWDAEANADGRRLWVALVATRRGNEVARS